MALLIHLTRWPAGDLPEGGSDDQRVDVTSMATAIALAAWFKHEVRRV